MASTPVRVIAGARHSSYNSRNSRQNYKTPSNSFESSIQLAGDGRHDAERWKTSMACKRFLDVTIASLLVVLLLPLLLLVALAIKVESSGPVLFIQRRVGMNRTVFRIYKFRSMHVLEDGPNVSSATRGDPRVTRVGRWIRQTSIDELPQLINVICGHMSLVGPRPHAVSQDQYYCSAIDGYTRRHSVRPGVTGWAQVSGHRGEIRTSEDIIGRVTDDVYYIENWSVLLDLKILLYTIVVVLRSGDVY